MAVNQLKAGIFLSYLSIGLNNIIGLTYIPFMLRMMGQVEYGLYSLVASVVAYLTVLDLGFGNALVRYTAKFRAEGDRKKQYQMFGMFLVLYSVIGLIAFIIGLGLYCNVDRLFDATMTATELYQVRVMMLLMVFNLAFTFPMSIWGAIITAYENFIFLKLVNIARIILNPLLMIGLLLVGYRAIGMVVVITLFNIATLTLHCWYCLYKIHIKVYFGKFDKIFFKEVSVYSFWIFLNAVMDRIYWNTGQFVLGFYAGAAAIAVYAIGIQLQNIYMGFSTAISGVFFPKITALVSQGNNEQSISDLFIRTGRIQYIIMAFFLSGFVLLGRQFIKMWAGNDYGEAYSITLFFLVPFTVPLIQNIGLSVLQARNQMKFRSLICIFASVICLGVSIMLAPAYKGIGCAAGTALALLAAQGLMMNVYYWKKIHIDIITFWKEMGKISIVPGVLILVGYGILSHISIENFIQFFIAASLFSALYFSLIWKLSMNDYEKSLLVSMLKRLKRHK